MTDKNNKLDIYADEYHRLLYQNQGRIYAYVLGLVGNYSDSDDIMQETISVMWRKFEKFEPGSDFVSWGIGIAHYLILEYRREKHKKGIVQYSDDVFDDLPTRVETANEKYNEKVDNLKRCLRRLDEKHFTVVKLRFFENVIPKEIAERVGLSLPNVYKRLSRAYSNLHQCLKNYMVTKEGI